MTLKSALQDLKDTTLSAVSGMLAKLAYLASLRRPDGHYSHWGMEMVHGKESSERALRAAHCEALAGVLRAPLQVLTEDLERASRESGVASQAYVEQMRGNFENLLPEGRENTPTLTHLNSVLAALSRLQKNRERATRLTS